jgi:hypothetical protein
VVAAVGLLEFASRRQLPTALRSINAARCSIR